MSPEKACEAYEKAYNRKRMLPIITYDKVKNTKLIYDITIIIFIISTILCIVIYDILK
jgi:hypothetical protein